MEGADMRRTIISLGSVAALVGLLIGSAALVSARQEADPAKEYHVAAEAGAWMVMITSYSGENAQKFAHDLALELRGKYDLPAYVFNRGKEEREKQERELSEQIKRQREYLERNGLDANAPLRTRKIRVEDQYAVLVGGYRDIDAARKELDKIRKLDPPKTVPLDSYGIARGADEKEKKAGEYKRAAINPFLTSFVVRNPLVPAEKPVVNDYQFLKELNADEKYSLLKCSKPWTLVVKEFFGGVVVQSNAQPATLFEKVFGKKSALDASAMQAQEVVRVLRDHMKIEAYVLHTRHGSIVAVGNYDSQDDPRLVQNQRMLQNMRLGETIQFFAAPLPMEVPHP